MSKRKPRDLSGRVESVEVVGGKLVLRGKCVGYRNDVTISIFPDDVTLVSVALTEFVAGNLSYQAARETRAATLAQRKAERAATLVQRKAELAAQRKAAAERAARIPVVDGVRIVGGGE